jgi:hypothetical protein
MVKMIKRFLSVFLAVAILATGTSVSAETTVVNPIEAEILRQINGDYEVNGAEPSEPLVEPTKPPVEPTEPPIETTELPTETTNPPAEATNGVLTTMADEQLEVFGMYFTVSGNEATITRCANNFNSEEIAVAFAEIEAAGYTITSIGEESFTNCFYLTSFVIPDSVKSIGARAFSNCDSLTSVIMGSGVTSIGTGAFSGCEFLESVTIGNSVTSLGNGTFSGCASLTSITIPDNVTSIGDNAFYACSSLTSVTFGSKVESIGSGAFDFCTSLTSVIIPDNVTSIDIFAFYGCTSLESVIIGNGVTSIGEGVFLACTSLENVTIGLSVTSIGDSAFDSCSSLANIYIPGNVTSIEGGAFSGCTSLASINIPDSVTSIEQSTFNDCTSLTNITIPDSVIRIDAYAFESCTSLTTVIIGNSVTSIGNYAFLNCTSLEIITIPDSVTSLGDSAFWNCTSLTTAIIGNGLTSISERAFDNCTSLANVTIGNSVTSIDTHAFDDCTSLTSITIPYNVTDITTGAFSGCSSLTSIDVDPSNTSYTSIDGVLFDYSEYEYSYGTLCLFHYPAGKSNSEYSVPDGVTSINPVAFDECKLLTSVTIPDSVERIDTAAFRDCTSLTSITIPDGVIYIEGSAFQNCTSLTSITIPVSVFRIGDSAFENCTSLTSVTILNPYSWIMLFIDIGEDAFLNCSEHLIIYGYLGSYTETYANEHGFPFVPIEEEQEDRPLVEGALTYTVSGDEAIITDCDQTATVEQVAADFEAIAAKGYTITRIGDWAFFGCKTLTSIIIPDSVTSIDRFAFASCTSLTSITIPNSVTSIGSEAFSGCSSLANITIPNGVTSIDDGTFSYCTSLTSITIPSSVKSIGNNTFSGCAKLTSVTIPDSVTSIGDYAFSWCTSLTSITIPGSVMSIGIYAFGNCTLLESIIIPGNVTSIGEYAFGYCTSLASVTIGSGLKSISSNAFYSCTSLTSVTIGSNVTSIGDDAFMGCRSLTNITIPDSVTSIGVGAFSYCPSLTITVDTENTHYKVIDNVLFDYSGETLVCYLAGKSNSEYIIPYGVTSIGEAAFEACTSLESITIPDNVTSIGSSAFINCTSLTSINVVKENAAYKSVDGVLFDYSVKTILCYPAGKSDSEYSIPDSVTSIGEYAFYSCIKLSSVTMGSDVTSMGNYAFAGCYSLTSMIIPDSVTIIGDAAFTGCTSLTSITIPDNTTSIGIQAFALCISLTGITIPDGVTSIGDSAFWNCLSLTRITIPDSVTEIGFDAFAGHSELLIIVGVPGSYAETYANQQNIPFVPDDGTFVTLNLNDATSTAEIDVNGSAPYGKTVVFYDNGAKIGTMSPNAGYRYKGTITLNNPVDGSSHVIKAAILAENGAFLAEATHTVIFTSNAPKLTEFFMYHDGQTINLVPTDGKRQVMIFEAGKSFTFAITLENYSGIDTLQVVSTRDGVEQTLTAMWDNNRKTYIATENFGDSNYVPNAISIRFKLKGSDVWHYISSTLGSWIAAIDPSGYLYEAVPSNRLTGVTATAWWKETPDSEPKVWDAAEFDMINPLTTDAEGRYAWDVPEGLWKVVFEKAGYAAVDTTNVYTGAFNDIDGDGENDVTEDGWLKVPPPQTEVNIAMISNEAPTITNVAVYPEGVEFTFSKYMNISSVRNAITVNGNTGTVTAQNAEFSQPDGTGVQYATIFRFTAAEELTGNVDVSVTTGAVSYAGTPLAAAYNQTIATQEEPKEIKSSNTTVNYEDETGSITVNVTPGAAAVGKKLYAVSSDENIATVAAETIVMANGTASVIVTPKLPGETTITFTLEGSSLKAEIKLTVTMEGVSMIVYGDADGDGVPTNKDVVLLKQYLADWNVEIFDGADADGDGAPTNKDVVLLKQYLADWDVTLG